MSEIQLSEAAIKALRRVPDIERPNPGGVCQFPVTELVHAGLIYINKNADPWIIRSAAGEQWVKDHPEPAPFVPTPSQLALLKYYDVEDDSFVADDFLALTRAGLMSASKRLTKAGRALLDRERVPSWAELRLFGICMCTFGRDTFSVSDWKSNRWIDRSGKFRTGLGDDFAFACTSEGDLRGRRMARDLLRAEGKSI